MKVYYRNNLKRAYLVLKCEENMEDDFQNAMLKENHIPGLLRTSIKYINNTSEYYYDISGKISLKSLHEKEKLKYEDIKKLVNALLQVIQQAQKYMLEPNGILLDPEYIYCERGEYWFCYYPPCEQEVKEAFHRLTEFFVREVDYKDKEGVHLAYTLHKATMEEHYSVEKIMNEAFEEETELVVRYDKRMEERVEEQLEENIAIAEEKGLWEPVRKLLERRKRDKWGQWDENSV